MSRCVLFVVGLVLGDDPVVIDLPSGSVPGTRRSIAAGLVVSHLRGWPAQRMQLLARSWAIRLRGPAATAIGRLYVSNLDLVWIPNRPWRAVEARDILIRRDAVDFIELVSVGRRSGLTIFLKDGSEVWFLLGRGVPSLDGWVIDGSK